jgi:hypothetical protein
MGERNLSNREIESMGLVPDPHLAEDQKFVRGMRACIRRNKMHPVQERSGKDRRVAINGFVDPGLDRRSGYDRRATA